MSAARGRFVLALLLVLAAFASFGVARASAHPMNTSFVELDAHSNEVTGEVLLPIDRLSIVMGGDLTAEDAAGSRRARIEAYTQRHIEATGDDGAAWDVAVDDGRIETRKGVTYIAMDLTLTPPDGHVTKFKLDYDVIMEQLVTHRALVTLTRDGHDDPQSLGAFQWDRESMRVNPAGISWLSQVRNGVSVGVEHISEGADHLLFLLMLLLPAPLVARGGRWRPSGDAWLSVRHTVHVVTAFAVGHSITLALGGFGLIDPPAQPVEALIALSVLVSAVHAIRPLVRGGEVYIAGVFGLAHGMAFATLLGASGLSGTALVAPLLGFNLGIELTQLLVVGLMMPSLYVLSRTRLYSPLRVGLALVGGTLAGAWLLERIGAIGANPLEPLPNLLIAHPFAFAGAFALLALIVRSTEGERREPATA